MSKDTARTEKTKAVGDVRTKFLRAISAGSKNIGEKFERPENAPVNSEIIINGKYPGLKLGLTTMMNEDAGAYGVKFSVMAGKEVTGSGPYSLDLTCMLTDDGREQWDMAMGGAAFKETFENVMTMRKELGIAELVETDVLGFIEETVREQEKYF